MKIVYYSSLSSFCSLLLLQYHIQFCKFMPSRISFQQLIKSGSQEYLLLLFFHNAFLKIVPALVTVFPLKKKKKTCLKGSASVCLTLGLCYTLYLDGQSCTVFIYTTKYLIFTVLNIAAYNAYCPLFNRLGRCSKYHSEQRDSPKAFVFRNYGHFPGIQLSLFRRLSV